MIQRAGLTLIELVVAVTLTALVGLTTIRMLSRQQRFYAGATAMLDVRSQLRDGADVILSDIRGAAVVRYGFPTMSDSAVEMYATVGSSVVCSISSGTLLLVPSRLESGVVLSSFLVTPDTGDIALVYVHSPSSADSSGWYDARLSSIGSRAVSTACPPSTGFTSTTDASAGRTTFAVTLAGGTPAAVRRGAPIRFLRRVRYSLYRSGDGSWQLGYRRCSASPPHDCSAIQPVSGPYRSYSTTAASGFALKYFNSSGGDVVDAALSPTVARVEVVFRGETSSVVSLTGEAPSPHRDSAVVTISPRNRGRL